MSCADLHNRHMTVNKPVCSVISVSVAVPVSYSQKLIMHNLNDLCVHIYSTSFVFSKQ